MSEETKNNDTNNNTPAPAADVNRKYEVLRKVNLGKGDVREPGSEISRKEMLAVDKAAKLEAGTTEQELLAGGHILDADAPIPPSRAEGQVAYDRLVSIAQKVGVLKRSGSEYRLGTKTANGLTAFRQAVSIDELEAAIVKKANG